MNFSFSSLKTFKQCPKQYHETKVLRLWRQEDTTATLYGTAFHLAAEEYVRDGKPLPGEFQRFEKYLIPMTKIKGTKLCEHEMGVKEDLSPCAFDDPDVFIRCIADLLVINEETGVARSVDYKTSKSAKYADTDQLGLVSAITFKHFPKIHTIKAGLLFVVADQWVPKEYHREQLPSLWTAPMGTITRIEAAVKSGTWNTKQGPLCRFCPVATCMHKRD